MRHLLPLALAAATLAACAAPIPRGPNVVALPPAGKDFTQFQREDLFCQQNAAAALGIADPGAIGQSGLGTAAVSTAVGAVAGGLIGAATGNFGAGAAIGAGAGLITGTALGAGAARNTNLSLQDRYDVTYAQCMSAAGNGVQPLQVAVPVPFPVYSSPYYGPQHYGSGMRFGFGPSFGYGRGYYRRW